jgi:hypothetical protein
VTNTMSEQLKQGDLVRSPNHGGGKVLAVEDGYVYVAYEDGHSARWYGPQERIER